MTKNNILRGLMAGVISLAWPMAIAQAQQAPVITPTGSEIVTCVANGVPKSCTTGSISSLGNVTPQTANKVYAGPASGGSAIPTFRFLQTGDIPTGTAGSTIPLLSGSNTWSGLQTFAPTGGWSPGNTAYAYIGVNPNYIAAFNDGAGGSVQVNGTTGSSLAMNQINVLTAKTGNVNITGGISATKLWSMPTDPQFGAKCDGTTDDTTALQAWANSATTGAHLRLPNSTCAITGTITFPVVNALTVEGSGSQSIVLYKGASTTNNAFVFGDPTGATQSYWLTIHNLQLQSNTVMTAGAGLTINNVRVQDIENIIIGGDSPTNNHFYNGFKVRGGGAVHLRGYSFGAQNDAEQISGNTLTDGLVDFYQEQGVILGSKVGIHLGGYVGGFTIDQSDILENGTNVKVDQSIIAVRNGHMFFGSGVAIDVTTGDPNIGFDLNDPGGDLETLVQFDGTWIASAVNSGADANKGVCLLIRSGVTWNIHFTGGAVTNCGTDGIRNLSTTAHIDITGTRIEGNGNWGINNTSGGGFYRLNGVLWPYGTMVANTSGNITGVAASSMGTTPGDLTVVPANGWSSGAVAKVSVGDDNNYFSSTNGGNSLFNAYHELDFAGNSLGGAPSIGLYVMNGYAGIPGYVAFGNRTYSQLPTCNSGATGNVAYITDAAGSPTWHSAVTSGGGSFRTLVQCNGTNWLAF